MKNTDFYLIVILFLGLLVANCQDQKKNKKTNYITYGLEKPSPSTLEALAKAIKSHYPEDKAKLHANDGFAVVSLKNNPKYIFKIEKPSNSYGASDFTRRLKQTKEMALFFQKNKRLLNKLVFPKFGFFTLNIDGEKLRVLVEERLNITPGGQVVQRRIYENEEKNSQLKEIAKQLAILVSLSSLTDMAWDNLPLIKEGKELKVALVDVEEQIGSPYHTKHLTGFIGIPEEDGGYGKGLPGLFTMLPFYGDLIFGTAKKYLPKESFASIEEKMQIAKKLAKKISDRHKSIEDFHKENNISYSTPFFPSSFMKKHKKDQEFYKLLIFINDVYAKKNLEIYPKNLRLARELNLGSLNHILNIKRSSLNFYILKNHKAELIKNNILHSYLGKKERKELETSKRIFFNGWNIFQF